MGETQDMNHPEAKLLSSCEPVKPVKLCASKIQWWDSHRIGIPIPKGRSQKEVVKGLKQVQNLAR